MATREEIAPRTEDLCALLADVEKAKGADRELDARIEAVFSNEPMVAHMGLCHPCFGDDDGQIRPAFYPSFFTRSLDACAALQERVLPGYRVRLDIGKRHRCWQISPANEKLDAYGATTALAWLASILRTLIAQEQDHD